MRWSRSYLPKEVAQTKVLEFVPQKIDLGTPEAALEYLQRKPGGDFRMNDQVEVTTGVDRIEKASDEERAERRALEMLAEIEEKAYQTAYQLGLDEGRKKAFEESDASIRQQMGSFGEMLQSMAEVKKQVLQQNETHMVKLMFHMASRIAMAHLDDNNEAILEVLRSAVALAQDEENILVRLHPQQIAFLEELRQQTGRDADFVKKIKLEGNADIRPGGCIVETNYGEVDARVETRLQQLWDSLADGLPRVKPQNVG
ncbi:MAG: flagellar assembly protein [Bdellovibrionaceae bacterium]|nr:flagellar assembly protein [Pseudobdellovibrionaceae bacterium]MBX3033055.1 flagellar assembly protein [Pseudobdellovibrionaceae bacterium]